MSSIVTRWVVRREYRVGADDFDAAGVIRDAAVEQWIVDARDTYLEKCRTVAEMIERSKLAVRARIGGMPTGEFFGTPSTVVVSAGVTELYPDSFTMAFRLRGYGQPGDVVANVTCAVSLEDPATGEACALGTDVRDELIALEHGARHTN
jgi:acyl-CoA thioesterase FadM